MRIELRQQTGELSHKVATAQGKWMLLLPSEFNKALEDYRSVFSAVTAPSFVTKGYPPELVNSMDPGMDLANAYTQVVNVSRKFLGTDTLTSSVSKMIGSRDKDK